MTLKTNTPEPFTLDALAELEVLKKAATQGEWQLIHVENLTTGKHDLAISDRFVPVGEKPTRLICCISPVELLDESDFANGDCISALFNSFDGLALAFRQQAEKLEIALSGIESAITAAENDGHYAHAEGLMGVRAAMLAIESKYRKEQNGTDTRRAFIIHAV